MLVKKSADQVVTNSTVLANDSELSFSVNSGETWYVQLLLSYSGSNANSDYKCGFTFPTGTGWVELRRR